MALQDAAQRVSSNNAHASAASAVSIGTSARRHGCWVWVCGRVVAACRAIVTPGVGATAADAGSMDELFSEPLPGDQSGFGAEDMSVDLDTMLTTVANTLESTQYQGVPLTSPESDRGTGDRLLGVRQREKAMLQARLTTARQLARALHSSGPSKLRVAVGVLSELVDDLIRGVAIEQHRALHLHQLCTDPACSCSPLVAKPGTDVFGMKHDNRTGESFECIHCRRTVNSSRFAPHLEKCMGKGGRTRRSTTAAGSSGGLGADAGGGTGAVPMLAVMPELAASESDGEGEAGADGDAKARASGSSFVLPPARGNGSSGGGNSKKGRGGGSGRGRGRPSSRGGSATAAASNSTTATTTTPVGNVSADSKVFNRGRPLLPALRRLARAQQESQLAGMCGVPDPKNDNLMCTRHPSKCTVHSDAQRSVLRAATSARKRRRASGDGDAAPVRKHRKKASASASASASAAAAAATASATAGSSSKAKAAAPASSLLLDSAPAASIAALDPFEAELRGSGADDVVDITGLAASKPASSALDLPGWS